MTERQLEMAIVRMAETFGWKVHTIADSRSLRSHTGVGYPDLTMVRGNRIVAAELKAAKGRVRKGQEEWLTDFREAGAEAYLWRPEHWTNGEVEKVLR